MDKAFYRSKNVCELLQVNRSTIWRWVREGHFPEPRRFGAGRRLIGWDRETIERFIKDQE
ncbi:helix-turn-helix transcriptional regulator [Desulfobotulus pelophilus]|uniref:helix-turn-helix transcriptional regulator n=1 Tax=Desulfobotulus pelophilus TaxID=2823377 RepID=UPI0034A54B16